MLLTGSNIPTIEMIHLHHCHCVCARVCVCVTVSTAYDKSGTKLCYSYKQIYGIKVYRHYALCNAENWRANVYSLFILIFLCVDVEAVDRVEVYC